MNKQEIEKAIAYWKAFKAEIEQLRNRSNKINWDEQEKAVDMAISALQQQLTNGWIPVSERLPEEETTYIVAWVPVNEPVQCGLSHYYGMFEFTDGDFDIDVPELFKGKEIIVLAWRPLPQEYKEVSK